MAADGFGRWTGEETAVEDTQTHVNEIQPELEKSLNRKLEPFEAIKYRSQIVGGRKVQVDANGGCVHVHLYVSPGSHRAKLVSFLDHKTLADPIETF